MDSAPERNTNSQLHTNNTMIIPLINITFNKYSGVPKPLRTTCRDEHILFHLFLFQQMSHKWEKTTEQFKTTTEPSGNAQTFYFWVFF